MSLLLLVASKAPHGLPGVELPVQLGNNNSVPWAIVFALTLLTLLPASQRMAAGSSGEVRRLGEWLLESGVLREPALTRALSVQWNCPVFSLEAFRPADTSAALPRFLADACGAVPVRALGEKLLYLASPDRVDRSLSYAVERMTGLRVVAGIARDSEFRSARQRYLATEGPPARYLEAASFRVLVRSLAQWVETHQPVESRLVRVHGFYWLRIWHRGPERAGLPPCSAVEDTLAVVDAEGSPPPANSDYREWATRR